jgi:cytochrome c-type biogenesis protein
MIGPGVLILAFGAGLGSFLLPCTLPLIPGYLSYISGLGADEMQSQDSRATLVGAATLFVLGFSLVFVALGATVSYIGSALLPYRDTLTRASGVFIILMALIVLGLFRLPVLYRETRFQFGRDFGIWSAFPLGMAFAFGWSPCIGPVLSSILAYATTTDAAQQGALLLFVYALGLGVPFLALAFLAGHMFQSLHWLKRYSRITDIGGGGVLLVMGVFLVLNQWTQLMAPIMRWYADKNLPL